MEDQPNLNYINSLSEGDKSFEMKLLAIIKKEFKQEKNTYYNNMKNDNFKLCAENVHKIKHKISILGLEKSYEIAERYENNLREGNYELQNKFSDILNKVTNYLNKL
ncbi:MAG: Hpt domain-containing protein [Flavobacteriaceae bacterium]|nr:Hpt domain-containing protein [Flavobacteriaceae bacterium]MDG1790378.1 Hpt domain-containing protein [Flavobacteriaceae bacterium]MDG2447010.1 Hpt domain-containing protein [Flavobacteriaceae bacterium]